MLRDAAAALPEVISIARAAGDRILVHGERICEVGPRFKGRRDLVTDADQEAEALILDRIRAHFPGDGILAEETGAHGANDGYRWIVDPLDGTTNFAHGLPFYGVSIARVDPEGSVDIGVVHLPRLGETFAAAKGHGASCNGRPIRVSNRSELIDAVLATGFHYQRQEFPDCNVDHFAKFVLRVRGIRRMGAACVDLAYLAAGRLDGFWEPHLAPWDIAAGALLVQEAGGRVTDMAGGDDWLMGRSIVGSNNTALHDSILEIIAAPLPGWDEMRPRIGGATTTGD